MEPKRGTDRDRRSASSAERGDGFTWRYSHLFGTEPFQLDLHAPALNHAIGVDLVQLSISLLRMLSLTKQHWREPLGGRSRELLVLVEGGSTDLWKKRGPGDRAGRAGVPTRPW